MPGSLYNIYTTLREHFGVIDEWWPIFGDDPPFEMLLGAVLVQQTRWEAVEQTVLNLRGAARLAPSALAQSSSDELIDLLRPVAFYRQKAAGLIAIATYLCEHYGGSTAALLQQPTEPLRRELLALPRIGPETADVILLYAGQHPVFVVDDYTRRVLGRVAPDTAGPYPDWTRAHYERVRATIEHELSLPPASHTGETLREFYAIYHALINEECVRYCLARRPRCDGPPARRIYSRQQGRSAYHDRHDGCPLRSLCAFYQSTAHTQSPPEK